MTLTVDEIDQTHVEQWRALVRNMILMDPETHPELLAQAIGSLQRQCEALYPQFAGNEKVMLTEEMMGVEFPLLDKVVVQGVLEKTGAVLLAGVDGPTRTGQDMIEEITEMTEVARS